MIAEYQRKFIEIALAKNVLTFGEFVLKSGRTSPYFFNAGKFDSGQSLAILGRCYAEAINASGIEFDVLFGPAYKGIPLAAVTSAALAELFNRDVALAYNRKEAKQHGEGGVLVGAGLAGKRVLIIDDVITAGTAIREVMGLLSAEGAQAAGVVIGLNRQEKGKEERSAVQEVEQAYDLPVSSIVTLDNIIEYLSESEDVGCHLPEIQKYRETYGV